MDYFYLGAYWHGRPLTLRAYADASDQFIRSLQSIHPVFQTLVWIGERPNSTIKLAPDLTNLDELIYRDNNDPDVVFEHANPDGSLAWNSLAPSGYMTGYSTGKPASAGGLGLRILAGQGANSGVDNAVTITFPLPADTRFTHREFYEYNFLKKLFAQVITFWRPQHARLTSHSFANAMAVEDFSVAGWLTYVQDPRVAALRNDPALRGLQFETMPNGEPLMSLGRELLSPDNAGQVELARRLHRVLVDEKLVDT